MKGVQTIAKWSFIKSEVYSMPERVTRLQLFANTLLLDEQHCLVERIETRQQDGYLQQEISVSLRYR